MDFFKNLIQEKYFLTGVSTITIVFFIIWASYKNTPKKRFSMRKIDSMDGIAFEEFNAYLLRKLGYKAETTKASNDQGIDIVAKKGFKKIAIQTKRYKNKVGNSAVQEVVAGKKHYNCNKTLVITNNYFTRSAIELAKSNNVELWDRDVLKEKIKKARL